MIKTFQEWVQLLETNVITVDNDTRRTQIKTTSGTYEKTGGLLGKVLNGPSRVINIGAGGEHTTDALHTGLGDDHGHTIHEMEPNPKEGRRDPDFLKAEEIPQDHYHAAVCHNVLNVLPPKVRKEVMHSIFRSLIEGGHAFIGTRGWQDDVSRTKSFDMSDEEENALWVKKKGVRVSYQKGFNPDELKRYVEDYAKEHGYVVEVTKLKGIAKCGVYVKLLKKPKRRSEKA